MQVVWSVEPDSAVLQLVFFLLFTANQRVLGSGVCLGKSTHKNTNLTLQQSAPSPLPGHCSHKVHPADTHKSEKQALVVQGDGWAAVPCLLWLLRVFVSGVLVGHVETAWAVVIRWPEGRWPLVVEFPANAARTRLCFLSTLGVENGAAAVTPTNTHIGQVSPAVQGHYQRVKFRLHTNCHASGVIWPCRTEWRIMWGRSGWWLCGEIMRLGLYGAYMWHDLMLWQFRVRLSKHIWECIISIY